MSDVYFASRRSSFNNSEIDHVEKLIDATGLKNKITKNDTVAIKLHFGERKLATFLRPVFIRPFSDAVKAAGGLPFMTDANTIYRGSRSDGVSHLETALLNGFSYSVTGAPVIIADGLNSENYVEVEIDGEYFKKVKIAGEAHRAKAMVVLSHFKGHEIFGFGGAIKNIGMGLASKEGKLALHSTGRPYVKKKKCVKCGVCETWCPAGAIEMREESSVIVEARCTGCGQCIMVCPSEAVTLKWDMDFSEGQKKTVEYALGAVKPKKGKIWFFNFLTDITPECDCYPYSDSPLVPDIGIMASADPVALDQASYDMVKKMPALPQSKAEGAAEGDDKFKCGHPQTNPEPLFEHAVKMGLGEREYKIIEI